MSKKTISDEERREVAAERLRIRRRELVKDASFIDEIALYFPGEGYRKVTLPPMGELKEMDEKQGAAERERKND